MMDPGYGLLDPELFKLRTPQALTAQGSIDRAMAAPDKRDFFTKLQERLMPVPSALQGLLSEEDIKNARMQGLMGLSSALLEASGPAPRGSGPTLGQALGRGLQAGMGGYQQALGGSAQMAVFGRAQQKELEQSRLLASLFQKYPLPENPSPEVMAQWIRTVTPELVSSGNTELLGKLAQIGFIGQKDASSTKSPQEIRLGNKVILRDPTTGKVVDEYGIGPSPRDPNAPDTAQQLRDQRMFQREQQLADDYNKDTKTQREGASKLVGAIAERDRAMAGDGASQINILYAFVNAMDPASAVREGEIGLARAAAPVWSQVQGYFQKYMTDGSVTIPPALVKRMTDLMERRVQGWRSYVKERSTYYNDRAKRWGVASEGLFPELDLGGSTPPPLSSYNFGGR